MTRRIEIIVLATAALIGLAAAVAGLWIARLSGSWTLPVFGAATIYVACCIWRVLPAADEGKRP